MIAVQAELTQTPFDMPIAESELVTGYIDWIASTDVPMLMLHGDDGVAIKADEIAWLRAHVTHLDVVDLGPGKHFLQETHPDAIGVAVSRWFADL